MLRQNYRMSAFVIMAAALLACGAPTLLPSSAPIPTFDPNSVKTAIAETAAEAATQTAERLPPTLTPTVTSLPTHTPSITPTSTATYILLFTTPTVQGTAQTPSGGTAAGGTNQYACELLSQLPQDNTTIAPLTDFETRWQVKNVGSETWNANNVDYRYASGDKLHDTGVYDMFNDVPPQGMADIIVKMSSPKDPGTYSTVWQLRVGKTAFCKLTLTIEVK